MTILLAPMEGLLDFVLRDILTRVGGVDRCVSEFIRVTNTLLPERAHVIGRAGARPAVGLRPRVPGGKRGLFGSVGARWH